MIKDRASCIVVHDGVVEGRVTGTAHTGFRVDVGRKSEGVVEFSEFEDISSISVGDVITVWVKDRESHDGSIVVSHDLAVRSRKWSELMLAHTKNELLDGVITQNNKKDGAYTVLVCGGIKALLPYAHTDRSLVLPIGHRDQFMINRIDNASNFANARIVLTYKHQGIEGLSGINADAGVPIQGVIKSVSDAGAVVHFQSPSDNRPLSGWLPLQDSTFIAKSAKSVFKEGEQCEVLITSASGKISLTNTYALWQARRASLVVGNKMRVKVYGYYSRYGSDAARESVMTVVLPDPDGKLPQFTPETLNDSAVVYSDVLRSQINARDVCGIKSKLAELFPVGTELEVVIKSIDDTNLSVALSLEGTQSDPWLNVEVAVGSVIKSVVSRPLYNRDNRTFFVPIPQLTVNGKCAIDGLLKLNPYQGWLALNTQDPIEATVVECDAHQHKIVLAYGAQDLQKQDQLIKDLQQGSEVCVTVSHIVDACEQSGLYVLYKNHLPGFIRENKLAHGKTLRDYQIGQEVNAIVKTVGFDFKEHSPQDRFILLSVVALEKREGRSKGRAPSSRATLGGMLDES
jgi:ribosomal protein S1